MEPFILFGDQHTQTLIWSTIIIIAICVAANFANNSSQSILTKIIGLSLLIFEATKPFIYIFGFDKPWEEYLPLHMCNFSAVLIGVFYLAERGIKCF